MSELTRKAEAVCVAAHEAIQQKRKCTGDRYYSHPIEVATIVRGAGGTDEMIAAAYLHDVVEDTGVSIGHISLLFGEHVAQYVQWLTDISKPEDGNRAARKKIDRDHIAAAPAEAKTIKLADLISNTRSIVKYDPEFAKVYMKEKAALLEVLTEGHPGLWAKANVIVSQYMQEQGEMV